MGHLHASGMQARVWLVCKHWFCLGMQLKVPVYRKCVHLCKFVVPSAVAALAVSLSKNCDESEEERARRLTRKWKRRQRDKRELLTCEVHSKMDEYERAAACEAKSGRLEKRPYPHVRWGVWNLTHFLGLHELFQRALCHPSHTLSRTWPTVTKALATPTNSNACMSPVGSKVMRCMWGMHCKYVHLVCMYIYICMHACMNAHSKHSHSNFAANPHTIYASFAAVSPPGHTKYSHSSNSVKHLHSSLYNIVQSQ